jgi:hypothetical protein
VDFDLLARIFNPGRESNESSRQALLKPPLRVLAPNILVMLTPVNGGEDFIENFFCTLFNELMGELSSQGFRVGCGS